MSDKPKLTKAQRKRLKKSDKRKASGSPESDSGGHLSVDGTPSTDLLNTQENIETERYVNTVLGFNTPPPVMNANHQNGIYGYQTPHQQHFQQQGQTPSVFTPTHTPTPMSPPAWAIPLMEDIKAIKSTMPKLEEIENSLKTMYLKISTIDNKITTLETKAIEMESSLSFISNEQDKQRSEISKSKNEVKNLQDLYTDMENKLKQCQQKEEIANDKLLDLEARSMRDNLMFYGIPETVPTQGSTHENCETLVKDLISTKLQLDSSVIHIDRAHRIGGDRAKKPRPIVVKFHEYQQRETVRQKSLEDATKASLRGSNLGIGVQSPQQYREARKALIDHSKREEQRGNRTRIIGNKLFVNNKPTKKYIDGSVIDL